MSLSITLDHAQKRLENDRIAAVAGGVELNGPYYSDTWIDPVTFTLMLRPAPLIAAWFTSNAGIYAKLAPSQFTATTPANWYTDPDYKMGTAQGPWVASIASAPGGLITNTVWAKNRGFSVSAFAYGAGDDYILMECGWNPNPNYLESVGLRLYSGGTMEVWKNGSLVGSYNISGELTGDQQTNANIDLLLIPCRRRELLVVSRQGNGFSHVFEDIEEDDADPVITPANQFWVRFPTSSAQVQIAPLRFPSTGYATSLDYQLAEAPATGAALETFNNPAFAGGTAQDWLLYGDPPYAGTTPTTSKAELVKQDNSGLFVPDGVLKACRIKVSLFGDGDYTPFVYAAHVAYARTAVDTDDSEEFAVHSYAREISLDVPDQPSGVFASILLKKPEFIEATVENLRRIANRPAKIEADALMWLDGQCEAPNWEKSTSDDAQTVSLEIRDRWKGLENYMFRERVPLDGVPLKDAIGFMLERIGLDRTANASIEDSGFSLPFVASAEAGDFGVMVEIGDTAGEWIDRLMEDYAATWHYGFEPTASGVKFVAKSPTAMDAAAIAFHLYPTIDDAITAGIAQADAWKHVYRTFEEEVLEPEANDVRVTGWDPRLQRAIQSHYPDYESQDPTLVPSLRPENWLGEPRRYGLFEPSITTQAACDRAATLLHERLTHIQRMAQVECELMVKTDGCPVWRGQDVEIHPYGRYRVRSFGCDFVKEQKLPGDDWQWRRAIYSLQAI